MKGFNMSDAPKQITNEEIQLFNKKRKDQLTHQGVKQDDQKGG